MGITIKDIAEIAGVSTSTVSLVISGKGYVSEKTKEKINSVISDYNYRPLRSARQLATGRTGSIGFIISDVHLTRSEAFYTRVLLGAELEARNYNSHLILSSVRTDLKDSKDMPRFLHGRDVDGVIIAGSVPDDLVRHIIKENIPLVLIDYLCQDQDIDTVIMDNRSGAKKSVKHLVEQDYKHIGYITGSYYHPSIKERFEGYQIEMERHGLGRIGRDEKYHVLIDPESTIGNGREALKKLLKTAPNLEAVVCGNDTAAMGCIQELKAQNMRIPEDVAVIGFDNNSYAPTTNPPLSSVHVPKIELGVEAVKLLMDRIENPTKIFQTILIPVNLIVRHSSKLDI